MIIAFHINTAGNGLRAEGDCAGRLAELKGALVGGNKDYLLPKGRPHPEPGIVGNAPGLPGTDEVVVTGRTGV